MCTVELGKRESGFLSPPHAPRNQVTFNLPFPNIKLNLANFTDIYNYVHYEECFVIQKYTCICQLKTQNGHYTQISVL